MSPNPESCSAGTEMMDEQSREKDSQSPVCARNSSHMPSGEKVVLWTRLKSQFHEHLHTL